MGRLDAGTTYRYDVAMTHTERRIMRKMGTKGGKARAANLSAAQLRKIAMKGVRARRKAALDRANIALPLENKSSTV